MTTADIIRQLADRAEAAALAAGATPDDQAEEVILAAIKCGLGPTVGLAVHFELRDRAARREGYADDDHREASRMLAIHAATIWN